MDHVEIRSRVHELRELRRARQTYRTILAKNEPSAETGPEILERLIEAETQPLSPAISELGVSVDAAQQRAEARAEIERIDKREEEIYRELGFARN